MTRAIVYNGEVVRYVDSDPAPGDLTKPHPSKPHVLPVSLNSPAFDPVSQVREPRVVTVLDDRVDWLDPVRDKTPEEVAEMVAGKVLDIKAEAQRRILAIMPTYRQTNWLALKAEMDLRYGAPSNWPAEVQQGIAAVMKQWEDIKAIRTRSDELEAQVGALTDPHEIDAFDVSKGWE